MLQEHGLELNPASMLSKALQTPSKAIQKSSLKLSFGIHGVDMRAGHPC